MYLVLRESHSKHSKQYRENSEDVNDHKHEQKTQTMIRTRSLVVERLKEC